MATNPFGQIEEELEEEEIEFQGKGSNTASDKNALRDEFSPDPFDWANFVASPIMAELAGWADNNGYSRDHMGQLWSRLSGQMFTELHTSLFLSADSKMKNAPNIVKQEIMQGLADPEEFGVMGMGAAYYQSTLEGMNEMLTWARDWWGKQGFKLDPKHSSGGGGRGGGGGGRGPTAQEIRDQFDLKELANTVNDMSRGIVLAEHKDALGLARRYVDAVVATGGKKKIDFQTFVRSDLEGSARFKSIYANKPASMKAEDYLQPYFQAAMGMARPEDADEIAIGGAQFGASAEAFRQRLQREDSVTGSAPFITGIEARLQELGSIFKGA